MKLGQRFFNIEASESGAASETEVVNETVNIAALMAKSGVQTNGETVDLQPQAIETEKKEEPNTAEAATSDVSSNESEKVVEVVQEIPKPEAIIPAVTPQKEETVVNTATWQEVLKQQQPDTVLKELGFDAPKAKFVQDLKEADTKLLGIMQAYKDGTLGNYLTELNTDYSKMPAEEVMRHQLRQEYPKASEQQLGILFKKEVVEKYSLDPERFDESEVEEGRLLLEAKAEKFRDEFMTKQEQYLLPKAPEPKEEVTDNTEALQQAQFDNYKKQVTENPYVQEIFTKKVLGIGEGDEKFNLPIENPTELTDMLLDSEKWKQSIFETKIGANGEEILVPDIEKQMFLAKAATDYKGLIRELAKHFKSLGSKAAIEPIDNASQPSNVQIPNSTAAPKTVAEAMAKHGTVNSGGY